MARLSPSRLFATACLFLSILFGKTAAAQNDPAAPHVRSEDSKLSKVIREGIDQSPTFRDLIKRLDNLPGLVYVVSSRCGTRLWEPAACLDHRIGVNGEFRFLRVNIHPSESGARRLLPLIAHELQHALEVLSDETVTTPEDIERLYARIGINQRAGTFETDAARRIQRAVYREAREWLRARRPEGE
jgi:hypothetical protein